MGIFSPGESVSTSTYTPHQQSQFNQLLGGADLQREKGFFDPSVYDMSSVAGMTGQQQQALQQQQEFLGATGGLSNRAMGGINQMLSGEVSPIYSQQAKQAADFMQQQFNRTAPRAIGDSFQGAGQFGSTRHGIADGLARSDLQQQTSNMVSDIFRQGAQDAQQQQQFALSNLGGLLGQAQSPYQQLFNVGGAYQQQSQAELSDLYNRRLAQQQLPMAELQAYQSLISGDMGGTTRTTTPTAGMGGAIASIGLGLAGSAFGGPVGGMIGGQLGSLFSQSPSAPPVFSGGAGMGTHGTGSIGF